MTDITVPFGTPPVGFMQTGNQTFENSLAPDAPTDSFFGVETPGTNIQSGDNIIDQFAPPSSLDFTQSTNQQKQKKQKYKIIDLFWLINPKFYAKQQLLQGEAHFVILSFNIDFGNMRLSYFNLTNNSIQNNIVYLENLKRTVSGTMYPATAFNVFNSPRITTICIEQLFQQTPGANWQQERPVCTVQKNEEKIRFQVKDPKYGEYFYDFISWQRDAFLHACNFTFTKGFELVGQQHINIK